MDKMTTSRISLVLVSLFFLIFTVKSATISGNGWTHGFAGNVYSGMTSSDYTFSGRFNTKLGMTEISSFDGTVLNATAHKTAWGLPANHPSDNADGSDPTDFGLEWATILTVPQDASYSFKWEGEEGVALYLDGKVILEGWSTGAKSLSSSLVSLTAGSAVELRILHWVAKSTEASSVLTWKSDLNGTNNAGVPGLEYESFGGTYLNATASLLEEKSVTFMGKKYAVIDFSCGDEHLESCTVSCQDGGKSVPHGWSIVPSVSDDILALAAAHGFGSDCLALADGSSVKTNEASFTTPAASHVSCGTSTVSVADGVYSATCNASYKMKILIVSDSYSGDAALDSSAVDFITWNGIDYATLDNVNYDLATHPQGDGMVTPAKVPTGWSVAEDSEHMRAAFLGAKDIFATQCLVLAGGATYKPNGGSSVDCGTDMLTSFGSGVYFPKTQTDTGRRILIARRSRLNWSNSWNPSPTGSGAAWIHRTLWTTMDGEHRNSKNYGCHDRSVKLPGFGGQWGYYYANFTDANTKKVVLDWGHEFGSEVLLGRDGSCIVPQTGESCDGSGFSLIEKEITPATLQLTACTNFMFEKADSKFRERASRWNPLGLMQYAVDETMTTGFHGIEGEQVIKAVVASIHTGGDPSDEYNTAGATQTFNFVNAVPAESQYFNITFYSKSQNVVMSELETTGTLVYAIECSLLYSTGWVHNVRYDFANGTHDWEKGTVQITPDLAHTPGATLKRVVVNLVLRGHTGIAWFAGDWTEEYGMNNDIIAQNLMWSPCTYGTWATMNTCDARILLTRNVPPPNYNVTCGECITWGDPHFSSFDENIFDFHGVGEYLLAKPIDETQYLDDYPSWGFWYNWQVHSWLDVMKGITINIGAAVRWHSERYEVHVTDAYSVSALPSISLNEVPLTFTNNVYQNGVDGVKVERLGVGILSPMSERFRYVITLPNHVKITILSGLYMRQLLMIRTQVPTFFRGNTQGLCGACDGNRENDFYNPYTSEILAYDAGVEDVYYFNKHWNQTGVDESIFVPSGEPYDGPQPPYDGWLPSFDPCAEEDQERQDMAELLCAALPTTAMQYSCKVDICVTGDPSAAEMSFAADSGASASCSVKTITRSVTAEEHLGGRTYALLDNVNPNSGGSGCQSSYLGVPEGWKIAEEDPVNKAYLSCRPWNTDCIVFASGNGYTNALEKCGTNMIKMQGPECFGVNSCNSRILIVKDSPMTPKNGKFQEVAETNPVTIKDWFTRGVSYDILTEVPLTGSSSLTAKFDLSSAAVGASNGLFQAMEFPEGSRPGKADLLGAEFRTHVKLEGVTDIGSEAQPAFVGIYIDAVINADGTSSNIYGLKSDSALLSESGWQTLSLELEALLFSRGNVPANAVVERLWVNIMAVNVQGVVKMSGMEVISGSAGQPRTNLLRYSTFEQPDDYETNAIWFPYGTRGFSLDYANNKIPNKDPDSGLMVLDNASNSSSVSGASQYMYLDSVDTSTWEGIYVGGWFKADGVTPTTKTVDASLYSDFKYNTADDEGSYWGYMKVTLMDPSADGVWQYAEAVHQVERASLSMVTLNAVHQNRVGKISLDGLVVLPSCYKLPSSGVVHGDPHYISHDGRKFDIQSRGEFVLHDDAYVDCQVRHEAASAASVATAVACRHHETNRVITIHRPTATPGSMPSNLDIPINDNGKNVRMTGSLSRSIYAADGETALGSIRLSGDLKADGACTFTIKFASGNDGSIEHIIMIEVRTTEHGTSFLQTYMSLPKEVIGNVHGLLGNANGDRSDDFTLSGTSSRAAVVLNVDDKEMGSAIYMDKLETFADSWRVTRREESLFRYDIGESVGTYDKGHVRVDLESSFDQATIARGRSVCQAAMVRGTLMKDCILDVLVTGDDDVAATFRQVEIRDPNSADGPLTTEPETTSTTTAPDETSGSDSSLGIMFLVIGSTLGVTGAVATAVSMMFIATCMLFLVVRYYRNKTAKDIEMRKARLSQIELLRTTSDNSYAVPNFDSHDETMSEENAAVGQTPNTLRVMSKEPNLPSKTRETSAMEGGRIPPAGVKSRTTSTTPSASRVSSSGLMPSISRAVTEFGENLANAVSRVTTSDQHGDYDRVMPDSGRDSGADDVSVENKVVASTVTSRTDDLGLKPAARTRTSSRGGRDE